MKPHAKVPPGYLLPANKNMADVLRLNDELLASESQGQARSGTKRRRDEGGETPKQR